MKLIKLSDKALPNIAKALTEGKIVAFPTDTIYGLIANVNDKRAINTIFKIKKRSLKKPLAIFVRDLKAAKKIAFISKEQERLLAKLWPGKVTVLLKGKDKKLLQTIKSKNNKIGIRIPKHRFLNSLLAKIDFPLAQTSANISGKKPLNKAKDILKEFEGTKHKPDLIVSTRGLKESLPSTVIDLVSFKIERKGQIKQQEIFKISNNLIR